MRLPHFDCTSWFTRFASRTSKYAGHPATFTIALLTIVLWAVSGPVFGFSDTWQLVINTGTTIVTFLMVFLIQNSQNRDAHAVQLKLDELIRAHRAANNALLDLEELDEKHLEQLRLGYEQMAKKARDELEARDKAGSHRGRAKAEPPQAEALHAKN